MRRMRSRSASQVIDCTWWLPRSDWGRCPRLRPKRRGAVFTMSNAAGGNQVVVFARAGDGTLSHVADYATGGEGSGGGLGSQGAVRLSDDGSWLLAVNAGSDEVSVFRVNGTTLELTDTVWSGGDSPISVDVHGDVVYVLNAGSANIAGIPAHRRGQIEPDPGCDPSPQHPGGGSRSNRVQPRRTHLGRDREEHQPDPGLSGRPLPAWSARPR